MLKFGHALIRGSQAAEAEQQDRGGNVEIAQFFVFMNYSDHYFDFLVGNLDYRRAIAELFLFRAWTTQFGFRIFTSDGELSERIAAEVVNQSKYLGKDLLRTVDGGNVGEGPSASFMSLLEERWQAYDRSFLQYRAADPRVPARMICSQVTEYCGVRDPARFAWLCEDFTRQLEAVRNEVLRRPVLA